MGEYRMTVNNQTGKEMEIIFCGEGCFGTAHGYQLMVCHKYQVASPGQITYDFPHGTSGQSFRACQGDEGEWAWISGRYTDGSSAYDNFTCTGGPADAQVTHDGGGHY